MEQRFDSLKQFTVGDFPPEVPPEHLNRVKPSALGGQVEQDQASRCTAYDRFDLVVFMGT
jgi:hypothetical protein